MPSVSQVDVLGHVRRMFHRSELETFSDGRLLECFLDHRDETAFALLVHRLGPMVLGVCRRLLPCAQDAEDAFQATFLVLARKGATVQPPDRVGNWLYGVACRTAREARRLTRKRQAREVQVERLPESPAPDEPDCDLLPALHRALELLPEKYRLPIVLCDLQGKMHKEAALQLGWPEGTLSGRLTRARQMLASRLARSGLSLGAGAGTAWVSQARAEVCPSLAAATVRAAIGGQGAAAVSTQVSILAQGVIQSMSWVQLKVAVALALVLSLLGGGLASWRPALFGGPANNSGDPGAGVAARNPVPNPPVVKERKRMELKEAEKLVRDHIFKENPKMNPTAQFPLKEVTTNAIWKRLSVQVFKVTEGVRDSETFVIKSGKVFGIGIGFGGPGVGSLGVADLDKSGPTLVYTYGWGSGIHRCHLAICDVLAKEPKEYAAPEVYFSKGVEDPVLKVIDDQTVEVYIDEQKAGRLALEGKEGTRKLSLILEENLAKEVRQRFRTTKRVPKGTD